MSYDQPGPHAEVQLNRTAVQAGDRCLSAEFIAAIVGLKVGAPVGRSCQLTSATA